MVSLSPTPVNGPAEFRERPRPAGCVEGTAPLDMPFPGRRNRRVTPSAPAAPARTPSRDLDGHPCFERWEDPESGVRSYLLRERLAPVQQSFYFTNPSLSADGRHLWLHAAFPPTPQRILGVVDLDTGTTRLHPQSGFSAESPMVEPDGTSVLYCARDTVWRLHADGRTEPVFTVPADYVAGRELRRVATHLTRSADGRYLLLDGEVGNHWFAAIADPASGSFRVVKEFIHHHNHAQFSPVDPGLFTIAMDHFHDRVTGRRYHYDHRIWLLDIEDRAFECLTPETYCKHLTGISHEWWSGDGRVCWVGYALGAFELDLGDRKPVHVWKEPLCHAHCNANRTFWCADESPYHWHKRPCKILFFDRARDRVTPIVTAMPEPTAPRKWYHIDPHPQFSPDGEWIIYTTTVAGRTDVALCPVAQFR